MIFKPNKIKELGELSSNTIKKVSNILNAIAKKPENIHIEQEEEKKKGTEIFYTIYLYFNLHFQKDKVLELFNNEKQFDFLYEKLIEFKNLFDYLIIPKEIVIKMLDRVKNYKQIIDYLYYLGKDCLIFLKVINEKKDLILTLFEKVKTEEKNQTDNIDTEKKNEKENQNKEKEEINFIEIEKYVEPKIEDNINEIYKEINDLEPKYYCFLKCSKQHPQQGGSKNDH